MIRLGRILLSILLATPPALVHAEPLDRTAIWQANNQSMVKIKVTGRDGAGQPVAPITGTGVIVSRSGMIVTALHVIGKDTDWFSDPTGKLDRQVRVTGFTAEGRERDLGEASAEAVSGHDIGILHINGTVSSCADVDTQVPGPTSSGVAILWDPSSQTPVPENAEFRPTDKSQYGEHLIVHLDEVIGGYSGSGVFDLDGRLTAIITNKLSQTQALAIPTSAFFVFVPTDADQCGSKGLESTFLDYKGPPPWTTPETIANKYPGGDWIDQPDGTRQFMYHTVYRGHTATIFFTLPLSETRFSSMLIVFTTLFPRSSIQEGIEGSLDDVHRLCGDLFENVLAALKDKIGPILDKPNVHEIQNYTPTGCIPQTTCTKISKNFTTEIHFSLRDNVVLRRDRISNFVRGDNVNGHTNFDDTEICTVQIKVDNPHSLKPQ